ncbi:MAG TPA: hypothetical protein VM577_05210 [Anaerovoracaceae bacterium]|nr:hypothetical protein [Anaerovoracaceae bacterium]
MDRNEFVGKADNKLKLVRTEYGYNQEKMADTSLGWSGAVTLCSIFERSEVLEAAPKYKVISCPTGGHMILQSKSGDEVCRAIENFIRAC